jgi:hypothetical protein
VGPCVLHHSRAAIRFPYNLEAPALIKFDFGGVKGEWGDPQGCCALVLRLRL